MRYTLPVESFNELKLSEAIGARDRGDGLCRADGGQAGAARPAAGPTDFIGGPPPTPTNRAAFGLPLPELVDPALKLRPGPDPLPDARAGDAGQITLFGKYKGVKALPIYGGSSYDAQIAGLNRGAAIVVGTPGR